MILTLSLCGGVGWWSSLKPNGLRRSRNSAYNPYNLSFLGDSVHRKAKTSHLYQFARDTVREKDHREIAFRTAVSPMLSWRQEQFAA
jgi:hypothetical protein